MIKSFTDINQSKKLAKILPLESADMFYNLGESQIPNFIYGCHDDFKCYLPCWSLAVLLIYLKKIKPQVYTPVIFPSEGKWILRFVEYGHGNVCEVCDTDPVDACVEMIIKLNELNLL